MGQKSKAAAVSPSKAPLPPSPAVVFVPPKTQLLSHSEDEETDDGFDDGTDGIDEKGMRRLMELLGDDALDELGAAQLDALKDANEVSGGSFASEEQPRSEGQDGELASEDEDSEGSDATSSNNDTDDSDGEESTEDGKMASPENEADEDEEEIALDDRDDISIDEDAVPKQKVLIDNKVRPTG
jgi:rRNA-processing protein EBP2